MRVSVHLLIDTPDGLVTTHGQLVELTDGACAIHVRKRMGTHHAGRVNLEVGGKDLWLPVVTRWVREEAVGWTVGCEFDRPTPEKQEAIRMLLRGH